MRAFVYLIVFFSFFDLFSQLPIMSPFAFSLGASSFMTGLAVGMYSFSNTIGNVISGFLTDKRGPFIILLVGLFASGASLLLYTFAIGPTSLLGIRFVHGFMEGLIVPAAFTFLANRAEESKRGRSVAISGAFVGMAAIFGPAYSGIVATKTSAPFIMSVNGVIMFILAIAAFFLLRSFTYEKKQHSKSTKHFRVRYLFKHPGMVRAFAGAFFLMFSQGVLALILPLKVEALGFDTKTTGMLLSTFGVVAILIFLLPINRIFDKVRPMITLAFGISMMGLSMLFLSQITELSLHYVAMMLYGIGFSFLFPSINSLLIDSSSAEFRGKAYGYFYAFFSIGVVAGSSLIGYLDLTFKGAFMLTGIILLAVALYTILGMKRNLQLTSE
ncbi:MFS transporter [Sporosarcina thermotolerans]|uniref:MFS transporter n=1 Tax=Sporosarcina thermotolerans TaxID=633404 RepID=A0AAW9AGK5_9BACL|nr:MFS transporter [Sporosarcina thermotolerans]MDW0118181.1 MFS transporter [Sporosarcina thermotolerans]WHT47663.1 MFS transporter [Sporosarcina thermotolerans]